MHRMQPRTAQGARRGPSIPRPAARRLRKSAAAIALHLGVASAVALPVAGWAGGFGIGTPGLLINARCAAWVELDRPDCAGDFAQTLLQPAATDTLFDSGSASNGVRGITNASATQTAAAGMGVLGARAGASVSTNSGLSASPHVLATADADATARWVDRLTASPSGVAPGTQATLLLRLPLSGALNVAATGIPLPAGVASEFFGANLDVRVRSWDTARPQATDTRTSVGSVRFSINGTQGLQRTFSGALFSGLTELPTAVTLAVPITIGTPFWLDVQLQTRAGADAAGPALPQDDPRYAVPRTGSATSEFLSTLGWAVPTLQLAGGAVVAAPELTSQSGTNYNAPIVSVGNSIFVNGFEP